MSCQFNSSAAIFPFSTLFGYTWWIIIVHIIGHIRFKFLGSLQYFSENKLKAWNVMFVQ